MEEHPLVKEYREIKKKYPKLDKTKLGEKDRERIEGIVERVQREHYLFDFDWVDHNDVEWYGEPNEIVVAIKTWLKGKDYSIITLVRLKGEDEAIVDTEFAWQ